MRPADAVIFAVAHEPFVRGGWPLVAKLLKDGGGLVLDVKWQLDRAKCPRLDRAVAVMIRGNPQETA